ncbi:dipeptidyl peptidase IV N-terminal region-domain-containing protein, partial [Obelidium mucronatum]
LPYSRYLLSPTLAHVLFESSVEKGWRHGYFATYHLFNVEKKTLKLLTSGASKNSGGTGIGKGKIALALWASTGDSVAWVRDNNIHVTSITAETEVQITTDGTHEIMNGVADWVYEEEVLSSNVAMWFSPDGTKLAYLKFDDSKVPSYKVQLFFHESSTGQQYPEDINIKYPKAGANNPIATIHIANPSATSASTRDIPVLFSPPESVFPDDDRLIVEAKWMEDGNSLMVRMMNRVQDQQRLFLVKSPETSDKDAIAKAAVGVNGTLPVNAWIGTLIRDEKSLDGAWMLNSLQSIHALPPSKSASRPNPGYLELAEDGTGYTHIAYYNSLTAKTPTHWLTKGDFEVTHISHIDNDRGIVYYLATSPGSGGGGAGDGSMQRHLYSVKVGDAGGSGHGRGHHRDGKSSGSDRRNEGIGAPVGEVGWYDVSFSKGGEYYLVTYSGPDVPFQKIVAIHDTNLNFPFRTNERVGANLKNYAMPRELYTGVSLPGTHVSLNAKLVVPNDFDASDKTKKYPVLISVYGGPNSQTVTTKYSLSFESALSATGYIIMYLDPRGTCCKGRAFRSVVSKQLGKIESEDVVKAAEWLIELGYADPKKIAVWGWSYGGFLASKVLELNSGVITTGIAVAPVTDWKFYDSVYTERYMKTPLLNPKGYETSAVSKMDGFKNSHFLLIHGTGDDNVHFQNSLALIWKLTTSAVHNYQVQFYPDSDHSMSAGNAASELFELLRRFLDTQFGMASVSVNNNSNNAKSKRSASAAEAAGGLLEERHGVVAGGLEWHVYNN